MVNASQISRQRIRAAWLFLAPTLVVLALVAGWPLLRTIWFGFTDAKLGQPGEVHFVGLDNFRTLVEDEYWWKAVWITVRFTGISVALETVLGLTFAMALTARFRGQGLLRAAVLVPWAIPTIVSAQMWAFMFNDSYGVINAILQHLHLISEPVPWIADSELSVFAVIAVDVWKTTPFMALLLLAALQQLPQDVYEAARIDGAHPVRVFFRITLPLIRGPMLVAVIFRVLDSMRVFDLFYILTNNSKESMSMAVYARQQMFEFQDMGAGAASATFLFAIIAFMTVLYLGFARRGLQEEM